jgi:hypothetical protein
MWAVLEAVADRNRNGANLIAPPSPWFSERVASTGSIMCTSNLHTAQEFIRQFALTAELESPTKCTPIVTDSNTPTSSGKVKPVGPWLVSLVFPH